MITERLVYFQGNDEAEQLQKCLYSLNHHFMLRLEMCASIFVKKSTLLLFNVYHVSVIISASMYVMLLNTGLLCECVRTSHASLIGS